MFKEPEESLLNGEAEICSVIHPASSMRSGNGAGYRKECSMSGIQYVKIPARFDPNVVLRVVSGHFATSQSHITRYMDVAAMKSRCNEAKGAARLLAQRYEATIPVDSIVCLDGGSRNLSC